MKIDFNMVNTPQDIQKTLTKMDARLTNCELQLDQQSAVEDIQVKEDPDNEEGTS